MVTLTIYLLSKITIDGNVALPLMGFTQTAVAFKESKTS